MSLEDDITDDVAYAQDPSTTPEKLDQLSSHFAEAVLRAVAQNMASPKEALARLFEEFTEEVLSNPASSLFDMEPEGPLAWIDFDIRIRVAKRETNSPETLARMAQDANRAVRAAVALNKATPGSMLAQLILANSNDALVLNNVSRNSNTPPSVLGQLATSNRASLRCRVAANKNTPRETLLRLASEDEPDLDARVIAADTLRLLDEPAGAS